MEMEQRWFVAKSLIKQDMADLPRCKMSASRRRSIGLVFRLPFVAGNMGKQRQPENVNKAEWAKCNAKRLCVFRLPYIRISSATPLIKGVNLPKNRLSGVS